MKETLFNRRLLGKARRIVVKVGSSSLTMPDGGLHWDQLTQLAHVLSAAKKRGQQVVLVSSGAAAAGRAPLGITGRAGDLHLHQASAMVGQSRLMAAYDHEFGKSGITIGQVLLTVEDVMNRSHYANAQKSLTTLLSLGVIPIVNENDAVVTNDQRFGDNDRLAALVSHMVAADALILLTDVEGLYTAPPSQPGSRLIDTVTSPADIEGFDILGSTSQVGTGGMRTKVEAAQLACAGGVPVLLTRAENIAEALAGTPLGTWFTPTGKRVSARTLWLSYAASACGRIIADEGAAKALCGGEASLLPVGVAGVAGHFEVGDLVEIVDMRGALLARGLAGLSSNELLTLAGDRQAAQGRRPAVHRDDLVRVK